MDDLIINYQMSSLNLNPGQKRQYDHDQSFGSSLFSFVFFDKSPKLIIKVYLNRIFKYIDDAFTQASPEQKREIKQTICDLRIHHKFQKNMQNSSDSETRFHV